jgi:hypothetical protein
MLWRSCLSFRRQLPYSSHPGIGSKPLHPLVRRFLGTGPESYLVEDVCCSWKPQEPRLNLKVLGPDTCMALATGTVKIFRLLVRWAGPALLSVGLSIARLMPQRSAETRTSEDICGIPDGMR